MDMQYSEHDKGRDTIKRLRLRNPWKCSLSVFLATLLGLASLALMAKSFLTQQLDIKGCEMSYMRPAFAKFDHFDTEHTRFADKYSLYLYREGGIDDDFRVKGVPVLFITGNAGSYKQVRSFASEAAYHFHNNVRDRFGRPLPNKRPLDFFTVDFNEDFTAFHGQTLLDQAEYLNDAIAYILSLYHTQGSFLRDSDLPDPTSIVIVGHSMGGVVARTMLTMPNYNAKSINTIITLATPHAMPPMSFDGDMVQIYKGVNDYWRRAHLQQEVTENPLAETTLISIAGGGLDTIVSSDYADVGSIAPPTHGFTVFTSSMPNVWTGMDHLAITWCDQNRKSIIRALYDAIDVSRATQTVPRQERMFLFKKWFLTGLEDTVEKILPHAEAKTNLQIDSKNSKTLEGDRLVLRNLGTSEQRPIIHLLPVPQDTKDGLFTLLTSEKLDHEGEHGTLEVMMCTQSSSPPEQATASSGVDGSESDENKHALACKSPAADVVLLPGSTMRSTYPFKQDQNPFSYLQYKYEALQDSQFVAIIDKAAEIRAGWVIAEFKNISVSEVTIDTTLPSLLMRNHAVDLPVDRPLMTEIKIPALSSSLLAYRLQVRKQSSSSTEIFAPLLRQHIDNVHESKFFVNVEDANINLHGISPYMPPAVFTRSSSKGMSLQIWSDPTHGSPMTVTLEVDVLGSLGKLWMRYRIAFATLPLVIVAATLFSQFRTFDRTGLFMSFAQAINQQLFTFFRSLLLYMLFLFVWSSIWHRSGERADDADVDYAEFSKSKHELFLGLFDIFFWFLVPLFGLMSLAICVAVNYVILILEYLLAFPYSLVRRFSRRDHEEAGRGLPNSSVKSKSRRVITTILLLSLVSTVIPYHFAYVLLCLTHIGTCVRALALARRSGSEANYNFYNYAHSILILLIWLLPINIPVLVVWVRNLAIHWLTPFSTHHNVLSILPFVLLVETLSTGHMVPRMRNVHGKVTNGLLLTIVLYATCYGVTYAYVLHQLANILCAWLVALHFFFSGAGTEAETTAGSLGLSGSRDLSKKRP